MKYKDNINAVYLKKSSGVNRVDYILSKCQGKSILHLGCVDSPFLEMRMKEGELLHQKIIKYNDNVWGVDLDGDGIIAMRDYLKVDNLFHGNIEHMKDIGLNETFDMIVVPEIIEHLNNPGKLMSCIGGYLNRNGQVLITVPNALSIKIFLHGLLRREKVHPDHNFYFSPKTLAHLIESHGFKIIEMHPYWCEPRSGLAGIFDKAIGLIRLISPWVGEGLVVSAESIRD